MSFSEVLQIDQNNETLKYYLQTVVVHSGNTERGHYYTFIKNFKDQQWRKFNDEHVTKVKTFTMILCKCHLNFS